MLLTACIILSVGLTRGTVGSVQAARTHSGQGSACIFDHMMLRSPNTVCRPQARAYPTSVKGSVQRSIYDSSLVFGIPFQVLLDLARCESSLNPRASNGSHFGLFQFAPSTFRLGASRLRSTTGVTARTYWNPLDSAYVAGYMFATGAATSWSCEPAFG